MDLNINDNKLFFNSTSDDHECSVSHCCDKYGNYRHHIEMKSSAVISIEYFVDI